MPFVATWMDVEMLKPSEVRQGKRNMNLKGNDINELVHKPETDSQT